MPACSQTQFGNKLAKQKGRLHYYFNLPGIFRRSSTDDGFELFDKVGLIEIAPYDEREAMFTLDYDFKQKGERL